MHDFVPPFDVQFVAWPPILISDRHACNRCKQSAVASIEQPHFPEQGRALLTAFAEAAGDLIERQPGIHLARCLRSDNGPLEAFKFDEHVCLIEQPVVRGTGEQRGDCTDDPRGLGRETCPLACASVNLLGFNIRIRARLRGARIDEEIGRAFVFYARKAQLPPLAWQLGEHGRFDRADILRVEGNAYTPGGLIGRDLIGHLAKVPTGSVRQSDRAGGARVSVPCPTSEVIRVLTRLRKKPGAYLKDFVTDLARLEHAEGRAEGGQVSGDHLQPQSASPTNDTQAAKLPPQDRTRLISDPLSELLVDEFVEVPGFDSRCPNQPNAPVAAARHELSFGRAEVEPAEREHSADRLRNRIELLSID